MVRQGHQLLSAALELADDVRQCITEIRGPHVLHEELVGAEASHDLDPLKVIIDLTGLGTPAVPDRGLAARAPRDRH